MTALHHDVVLQRYLQHEISSAIPWNETIASIINHRSVRAYLDTPLPRGLIEVLVAAAQSAATSSNLQAWSVLTVEDPKLKSRLATLAGDQDHIRQAPLFLVWLADLSRIGRAADRSGAEIDPTLDGWLIGSIDAALAAQNAVIALESLGLGSVYIGGLRNHLAEVVDLLGLPPLVFPVFGLCVGFPDPDQAVSIKPRLPQQVIIHRERYGVADEEAHIERYDAAVSQLTRTAGTTAPHWSNKAIATLQRAKTVQRGEEILRVLKTQLFSLHSAL